jgi:N-acetylmuramoyl-L-alanine amidase
MHRLPRLPLLILVLWSVILLAPASAVRTVVVDAGHGGQDRGGGPGQRIPEKPYTLDVALRLRNTLMKMGYRVVMTRSSDYFVGLGGRCAIANKERDAIFVSVHFNSAPREGANGIETYYYSNKSSGLAAAVHRQVVRFAGTEDRRVRRRGFYVIRNTRIPSILCECGFLTNGREAKKITNSVAYRQGLADAIARGIQAWD